MRTLLMLALFTLVNQDLKLTTNIGDLTSRPYCRGGVVDENGCRCPDGTYIDPGAETCEDHQ